MRRKDRAMDEDWAWALIDQCPYGVLSLVDEHGEPYGVPLSMARQGHTLYFHGARQGKKAAILAGNPVASVAFVGWAQVPELFSEEELADIGRDPSRIGVLLNQVFTTEFASVLAKGKVELLVDDSQKVAALELICQKYTPTKMAYFPMAIERSLSVTNVYRLAVAEIKGKRKKYDEAGD